MILEALLYTHAVLPTLEDLLTHSVEARKLLGKRNFRIRLSVPKICDTYLHFVDQKVRILNKPEEPDIHLYFKSPLDLVELLKSKRPTLPHVAFPKKPCPQHLHILPGLLQTLENQLKPPHDEDSLLIHIRLLITIAYRALPFLSKYDPKTQAILQQSPTGILFVKIQNTKISGWISWDGNTLSTSTKTAPPHSPDTIITFKDPLTAYHAFNEKLDTHAAIGLQKMKIEGNLPLADRISELLERLTLFLPR